MNNIRSYHLTLTLVVFSMFMGCESAMQSSGEDGHHGHSHSHDHSNGPETFQAAVVELKEIWATIQTAMENDDPDLAHDPLHDVGHLIEAIPDLAAETDLPEEKWNDVKANAEQLFDDFDEIDAAFHEKDGDKVAAYESVKTAVDEGIAKLEANVPQSENNSSHEDHEHEKDSEHGRGEEHE